MFSIIVPVFNRANHLRRSLDAILAAAPIGAQIVVVDDGSTDDTSRILASYGDRLVVARQDRGGPGAARNRGIELATHEYIAFMDSDDLFFPWAFDVYRAVVEQYARPSLVIAHAVHFRSESELVSVTNQTCDTQAFPDYIAASGTPMWHGASVIVAKTAALREAGGFFTGDANAEDSDILLRMGTAPGFVRILAPATVADRNHDAAATSDLSRSARGVHHIVRREAARRYPGGDARQKERATIITRHSRAMTLNGARNGLLRESAALYADTMMANLSLGRLRYVIGFPFVWLWHALFSRRLRSRRNPA
ncbi:MAG: glycosyltransferase family 2 protein [Planctomycetaceae bacterium]